MKGFLDLIRKRPVRFAFLVEAILGAVVLFGVPLDAAQIGACMLVLNATLAFWLDNYTTPVDGEGIPLSDEYERVVP